MSENVIELEHVWVKYRHRDVLEDISLSIGERDFYGIIGPNGGGKTTLLKVMLGLISPSSGTVRVLGGTPEENRRCIGYVPQYRTFDFGFPISVLEMVMTGRLGHIGRNPKKYREEDRELARKTLRIMGIEDLKHRQIDQLSGGQQQRAMIARALVTEPKVLLLDEPTVHIDVQVENQFYDLLKQLHTTMAIVLVTHDIGAVSVYVDKIACLNRRLFTHDSREITGDMLAAAYQCPVDLVAHGLPHRVLREHGDGER
jgi:zinc transport system ATP-binding protein